MSELDEFFGILDSYKRILAWALGGSAILPLIATLAGLAPIWPPGVSILTSLFTLVAIIFCFQFFRGFPKFSVNGIMSIALFFFICGLVSYLWVFSNFTTKIPTTKETIYLGCGWSDFTKENASDFFIDPSDGCPGNYQRILKHIKFESSLVWTKESVTQIRIISLLLWLAAFSSLAIFIASFLVFQSKEK